MTKVVKKLTKLRSAIKRWPSFTTKLSRSTSSLTSVAAVNESSDHHHLDENPSKDSLHAVYVGKSRRRYMVGSDVMDHPLFQELADMSAASSDPEDSGIVVSCEVVLFEHLLWMLQNAGTQLGSTEELVEFYTC